MRHRNNCMSPHLSAIEHQILAEGLRRVARVRPDVAMVMVEVWRG